ncbi:hypothetical protein BZA05DRAFT_476365 [Tricharina praecox]|uniref:uncharacterized protein n=1 Tax=Tricharina praecox TaxID=43433 RepID=UPI00221EC8DB|nr:uncharacterized protein BZA05DRAFT_476365 [Tricharina praecox]KAI5845959.1 hypothetical protein BZA05DRAFT_476365 [Tricharina praecox]
MFRIPFHRRRGCWARLPRLRSWPCSTTLIRYVCMPVGLGAHTDARRFALMSPLPQQHSNVLTSALVPIPLRNTSNDESAIGRYDPNHEEIGVQTPAGSLGAKRQNTMWNPGLSFARVPNSNAALPTSATQRAASCKLQLEMNAISHHDHISEQNRKEQNTASKIDNPS